MTGYESPREDGYEDFTRTKRRIRLLIVAIFILIVFFIALGQSLNFWLNTIEFGEVFTRPIYYTLIGGIVLASVAFFRVDYVHRRSLLWWGIRLLVRALRTGGEIEQVPAEYFDFSRYKVDAFKFTMWQITKVLFGMLFMGDVFFGMSLAGLFQGYSLEASKVLGVIPLSFATPPVDSAYSQEIIVPAIPTLTLIASPLLAVIAIRLFLLLGLTEIVKVFSLAFSPSEGSAATRRFPIATIEALVAVGLFWTAVNLFFPSYIDYNTRYVISGLMTAGIIFATYAYLDKKKRRFIMLSMPRTILLRLAVVFMIILITGAAVAVQHSIADARKGEWLGPYVSQEISVNRYLAELDKVRTQNYEIGIKPVPSTKIPDYMEENQDLLSKIRLWDTKAAFTKLKPEIGLAPYVDFVDSDILRFDNNLYWSASMTPILPKNVRAADVWYAEHLVYTHVPKGYLFLHGNTGTVAETERFFSQRRVYYGEGGLFSSNWAAYPGDRAKSEEIEGYAYDGRGGITVYPPLSWLYEVNFFLSYPDRAVKLLRYRDVHSRMENLFPYFTYRFGGQLVDILPVTDGKETYWLMPLIVSLDTRHIPWSGGNPILRLVGYALINTYHGDIKIIVTGKDFFSRLFLTLYSDLPIVTQQIPEFLAKQIRYPEELFEWRVSMFNTYHVTDPASFIRADKFLEVPKGLDTYFIINKTPGLKEPEFQALLSLERRGALGRNLAGYIVARQDHPNTGEMIFYSVDPDSATKLLGPSAATEALERNPDFAILRRLLGSPRVGDIILYRVGEQDVYFVPIYSSQAGGVVTEMAAVAAVGASFTGQYHVGLFEGASAQSAFKAYLVSLAGGESQPSRIDRETRLNQILQVFSEEKVKVARPVKINANLEYLEASASYKTAEEKESSFKAVREFIAKRVKGTGLDQVEMWLDGGKVNFGVVVSQRGISELHFLSIDLGEEAQPRESSGRSETTRTAAP